jgi:hypothetical protein
MLCVYKYSAKRKDDTNGGRSEEKKERSMVIGSYLYKHMI